MTALHSDYMLFTASFHSSFVTPSPEGAEVRAVGPEQPAEATSIKV